VAHALSCRIRHGVGSRVCTLSSEPGESADPASTAQAVIGVYYGRPFALTLLLPVRDVEHLCGANLGFFWPFAFAIGRPEPVTETVLPWIGRPPPLRSLQTAAL
jgi:hypothetical protein